MADWYKQENIIETIGVKAVKQLNVSNSPSDESLSSGMLLIILLLFIFGVRRIFDIFHSSWHAVWWYKLSDMLEPSDSSYSVMICRFFYVHIFLFLILESVTASQLRVGWLPGPEKLWITISSQFIITLDPASNSKPSPAKLGIKVGICWYSKWFWISFRWSPPVPASARMMLLSAPKISVPFGAGGRNSGANLRQTSHFRLSGVEGRSRDPYPPYLSLLLSGL